MRHFKMDPRNCEFAAAHFMARGPWGRGDEGRERGGHGGRGGAGHVAEHFMQRILGHGDLRFVILALLEEKPSHGYELIKDIGDKSHGQYQPSPGVIYPTLTFLQEGGFATVTTTDNKNLYTITDDGRQLLAENRAVVDAIFERMSVIGEKMSRAQEWFGREMDGRGERGKGKAKGHGAGDDLIRQSMHQLRAELMSRMPIDADNQAAISAILQKAVNELKALKK